MDLPQSLLEPVLVKYATTNGFKVRFDTQLLSFTVDDKTGYSDCLVKDAVAGTEYTICTRFLFGADGARSKVMEGLSLPMTAIPSGGTAWNVLVKADLSHLMPNRHGNLHWCLRMQRDYEYLGVARMVKPWHEWMFVWLPKGPAVSPAPKSFETWKEMCADLIGDPSIDVEVLRVNKWVIHETSADVISKGNIFALGDAIHRHPPVMGLGSNTCIQDAYNLSWKINLVLKGLASPSLLETYNTERQPVGAALVTTSNDMLRKHMGVWKTLGCTPPGTPKDQRLAGYKELCSNTKEGKERRKVLAQNLKTMNHETAALGHEMNQTYTGPGVYLDDEPAQWQPGAMEAEDKDLYHTPSTYPGRRLPHVWLNTAKPGPLVSTLDVAGKGRFSLFMGIGAEGWRNAVHFLQKDMGVDIKAIEIGRGLEWEDPYSRWEDLKGVEDEGCVLVRPDCVVAWRSVGSGDEENRLRKVMKAILGLEG